MVAVYAGQAVIVARASLVLGIALTCGCGVPHPSDEELLQRFRENRQFFEELSQKALEDPKLFRVSGRGLEGFGKTPPITQARWQEYKVLLEKLQLACGLEQSWRHGRQLVFCSNRFGPVRSVTEKGFYLGDAPETEKIVETLDEHEATFTRPLVRYRHIEDNWYLYLYEDPG